MKNNERFDKEFQAFLLSVGEKIKSMREKKGITQENMENSQFGSIEYKFYQRIEYGEKNITLKTLFKICKKLGISPKDLFK